MLSAKVLNESNQYAMPEEIDYLIKEGSLIYSRSPFLEFPAGGVVMLGAGPGVLALAAMQSFIDTPAQMPMITVVDNVTTDYAEVHLRALGVPEHKMRFKLYDSADYAKVWTHGPVGVLIVDADHSTNAVLRDIDAWFPHVASRGLIFFHDVLEREGGFNGSEPWKPGPVSVALEQRKNLAWDVETHVGISVVYRKR